MASDIATVAQTHVYTADATAGQVAQDLGIIREKGRACESLRFRFKLAFWLLLIPAVFIAFVGLGMMLSRAHVAGFIVLAVAIGLCVFCFIKWRSAAGQCVQLPPMLMVERVLSAVSRDMDPAAPVKLHLDLRPHVHPSKLKRTGELQQWKVKFYVDPWLELKGRLLDGTAFRLKATTLFQARHRWAKSRSGKSKLKKKSKESTVVTLQLKFKPKRYPRVAQISNAKEAVQVPQGVMVRQVKTGENSLLLSTKLPKWDTASPADKPTGVVSGPHTVAMMFLSAYQVLNLSKAMVKADKSGGGK